MSSQPNEVDLTQTFSVLQPGSRFSHYEIISKIGAGGMGEVYLSRDNVLARNVVLKFLSPHLQSDNSFKTRFLREAKTAASLNHPNVITIYEVEESENRLYIAMEQVKGKTLKQFLEEEKPDPRRILGILSQICSGLQAAHENDIIHRDIKPDNIMISKGDFVKVLDFGLAKIKDDENVTRVGTAMGTVNYMSPEQGQGFEVDHRSDIFSVGIVFFEMLTRQPAFAKGNMPATIHAIVHDELPPLKNSLPDIPQEYQNIIDKCLAKEPAKRYQAISQMLSDINEFHLQSGSTQIRYQTSVPTIEKMKSLAVLCLNNLGAPEDEFLCYGISEDLIVDLTRLGSFRVVPMRSVLKFRNSEAELSEIAIKLDVDYILDGSLMKMGSALRISAQLVEVSTHKNLWADRWEASMDDLPYIKTDLAHGIGQSLKIDENITDVTDVKSTADAHAYEFYLRGKYAFDRKKNSEDVDVAHELFKQAIQADPSLLAANLGIATIQIHNGQLKEAISHLNPLLTSAREANQRLNIFNILLVIGEAQIRLSNWDEGKSLVYEALEIARELKDISGEMDALRLLIDIDQQRAEFKQALIHFERVMEISRQMDNQELIAESLKSIANVHFRKGEYSRAKSLYNEAIDIAHKKENLLLEAKCICNIGLIYSINGDLDTASECYHKSLEMCKQVGDKTGQANAYNNLALVHSARGSYEKAIEFGQKSADLKKEIYETAGYALSICNVARYQAIIGKHNQAISSADNALSIAQKLKYPFVINLANDSIGYCYFCHGDYKNAIKHYNVALKIAQESDLKREAGLAFSNLAECSYYNNELDNCYQYANQAFKIAFEFEGSIALIRAKTYQAVMKFIKNEKHDGIELLESTLKDAVEFGDPRFIINCKRLLSKMIFSTNIDENTRNRANELLSDALNTAEQKNIQYEVDLCKKAKEELNLL